ncbi:DUF4405 domain-containing protein [Labilibaculum sp.]|uniref:DUF4405 domain-containing protein n=1 Tax=Labilibaculum sp. TaxID=2060723 RepID=UPI00356149A2
MKEKNSTSKPIRNYYVDIAAFLPFLMLLITGMILLPYHAGKVYSETILGQDRSFWLETHIVFAFTSLVLIVIHFSLHLSWFKNLFSGEKKNKYWVRNLILLLLFLATTLTSIIPFFLASESKSVSVLLGIHNKFGLLLIVFIAIHLFAYFKWLEKMTKKVLGS